jgi:hypothetical protein
MSKKYSNNLQPTLSMSTKNFIEAEATIELLLPTPLDAKYLSSPKKDDLICDDLSEKPLPKIVSKCLNCTSAKARWEFMKDRLTH